MVGSAGEAPAGADGPSLPASNAEATEWTPTPPAVAGQRPGFRAVPAPGSAPVRGPRGAGEVLRGRGSGRTPRASRSRRGGWCQVRERSQRSCPSISTWNGMRTSRWSQSRINEQPLRAREHVVPGWLQGELARERLAAVVAEVGHELGGPTRGWLPIVAVVAAGRDGEAAGGQGRRATRLLS